MMSSANHLLKVKPVTEHLPIVKAHFISHEGVETSNVGEPAQQAYTLFREAGALSPPIPIEDLNSLLEMSGSLRTSVDAYGINIDGFGHEFEPVIDLEDSDIHEVIRQALLEEKIREQLRLDDGLDATVKRLEDRLTRVSKVITSYKQDDKDDDGSEDGAKDPKDTDVDDLDIEVTDQEVEAKLDELKRASVWELERAKSFFDYCCPEMSFPKLRVITRQDIETIGNGYWEVLRNEVGTPVQLNYIPGYTIRLMPADRETTEVVMQIPRTILRVDEEVVKRRFRRYVQVNVDTPDDSSKDNAGRRTRVFFKEYGDHRIVSRDTGLVYNSEAQFRSKEPDAKQATEIMHYKVHSSHSAYGVPRWVSELLAVLGNREAEEINLAYFENKAVPPMAILVSGGRLSEDETTKLKDFIKNEIRGKKNFHKVMILQAEPFNNQLTGNNSGTVKIEIKPLTSVQQNDGLFMDYQQRNADKIGSVFRLPRIVRGDSRDFNRATAESALRFTEKQVFAPLRRDFDWVINRMIMPEIGIRLWSFVSKGPDTTDLSELGALLKDAADSGYLNLLELRQIGGRVFGKKFAKLEDGDEDLAKVPLELLRLGAIDDDGADLPEDSSDDTPEQTAKRTKRRAKVRAALKFTALETHFCEQARRQARQKFEMTHDPDDLDEDQV